MKAGSLQQESTMLDSDKMTYGYTLCAYPFESSFTTYFMYTFNDFTDYTTSHRNYPLMMILLLNDA